MHSNSWTTTWLRRRARAVLVTAIVFGLGLLGELARPTPVAAQELPGAPASESETQVDPLAAEQIDARLEGVETEILAAERAAEAAETEAAEALPRLRAIANLLEQEQALATEPDAPRRNGGPVADANEPISVFALNSLYERAYEAAEGARSRSQELAARRAALDDAKEIFDQRERERRESRVALEDAGDSNARAAASRTLRERELESRIAQETVYLRTLETRRSQRALQASEEESPDFEAQAEELRGALAAGRGDSEAGLSALSRREGELRRRRESLERNLTPIELRLAAAQRRFSEDSKPPDRLLGAIETLSVRRDALQQQVAMVDSQLQRLGARREILTRWEEALAARDRRDSQEAWILEAERHDQELATASVQKQGRIEDLRERLDRLGERIAQLDETEPNRALLEEQHAALADLVLAHGADARALAAERRLVDRALVDFRGKAGSIDPVAYAGRAWAAVRDTWAYEVTAVDDSPITVGSLVLALILAAAGFYLSRSGSTLVGRLATNRLKLDVGAAHALQSLSFYALLVAFTLLALRTLHFPLTAFTVLGGALAIGIGFGSQNVMNNFISGLILMLERPVRARDLVEIDGNHGTVERIGARSTQIRSTDGRHIVVPNSFFLENNVVNWTLSDDLVRAKVSVGVIYGSPTRLVEELINQVVQEESWVLKQPEPIVVFEEFGDNSLNFDVYFWVKARSPMSIRHVQSRIRFAIDDLFRQHGLVIAFPQRDVHLDSATPIEVRVVDGNAPRKIDP